MRTIISKHSMKKAFSKVKEVKVVFSLVQELLYLLFILFYGSKPLLAAA